MRTRESNALFETCVQRWLPADPHWSSLRGRSKQEAARTGVEFMSISEGEARLLQQLIKADGTDGTAAKGSGPQKWIEVGGLTGYSALAILEVLPAGSKLWVCELQQERCQFLQELFKSDLKGRKAEVLQGDSKASLPSIESQGPFDGFFLDGAKGDYLHHIEWAEKHLKSEGLLLVDNIFQSGKLFETDARAEKAQEVLQRLLTSDSWCSVLLPTADGLMLSRKR